VAARLLFESKGIAVDRELRVLNGGCCEDIAFTVIAGTADAGVTCDHFLAQHGARQQSLGVDPAALAIIGRTVAFPTRLLAARKGVPAAVIDAVAGALLRLDPSNAAHAGLLKSAEIGGFFRTTGGQYVEAMARPEEAARR
jgi:ABC-type phosphate/phosphonate transport system substrate-binding protein